MSTISYTLHSNNQRQVPQHIDEEAIRSYGKENGSVASKLVGWIGTNDPEDPQNWSLLRKTCITVLLSFCTFVVSFGSSVLSPATEVLAGQYNVAAAVITLTITLYVLGFAAGPWVWAPLSECIGRYWPFMIGYVGFMCFTVGVACASNLYTIMLCRFFQGAWGISSLTVTPGIIVDLWGTRTRPLVTMVWTMTIQLGPSMGPIVGSFTVKNESLGWRWTMWFTLIISAFFLVGTSIVYSETWSSILLQKKASRLRFETKDWALHAERDEQRRDPRELARKYGLKPMKMLFQEPILMAITLYNCFVYGITYLTFEAFPYAFGTVRGWEDGLSSLPFLSLFVGFIAGFAIQAYVHIQSSNRRIAKGLRSTPEDQLPPMIGGSFILMTGLFWFAWTSSPSISWVSQIFAGPFIGCGISLVFIPCVTYLIECYTEEATSALAANTIARSAVAAAFPLFSTPMYETLGVDWATSLLAFLTVAFTPAPIIFYVYGSKIRSWSKFAFAAAEES